MIKNSLIGSFQFLQPFFRIRIILRILLLLFPLLAFVSGQTSDTCHLFSLNTQLHNSNQFAKGAIEDGTELKQNGTDIALTINAQSFLNYEITVGINTKVTAVYLPQPMDVTR